MADQSQVAIGVRGGQHDVVESFLGVEGIEPGRLVEQREVVLVLARGMEDEARVDVRPKRGDREGQVPTVLVGREDTAARAHVRQQPGGFGREVERRRRADGRLARQRRAREADLRAQDRRECGVRGPGWDAAGQTVRPRHDDHRAIACGAIMIAPIGASAQ